MTHVLRQRGLRLDPVNGGFHLVSIPANYSAVLRYVLDTSGLVLPPINVRCTGFTASWMLSVTRCDKLHVPMNKIVCCLNSSPNASARYSCALCTSVVAMVVLFGHGTPGEIVNGGYTNITLGWGFGRDDGDLPHSANQRRALNPAVTVTLQSFAAYPLAKVLPTAERKSWGGFFAPAVTFWNYRPAFLSCRPDLSHTAECFTTFPTFPDVPMAGCSTKSSDGPSAPDDLCAQR